MDYPFYMNLIEQAQRGSVLFKNFMTPVQHDPVFFHPLFFLMGRFAAFTGIAAIPTWHIFWLCFLFLFLLVLRGFLSTIFSEQRDQQSAFFGILFGGLFYSSFYEASVFRLLFHSPLTALSILTTLLWFWLFVLVSRNGWRAGYLIAVVLLGAAQTTVHPYILLLWGVVPLAYTFFSVLSGHRSFRSVCILLLPFLTIIALGVVYLFFLLQNPVLREWSQAAQLNVWPWYQFAQYGVVLVPLAVVALFFRRSLLKNSGVHFLILWFLLALVFSMMRGLYPYAARLGLGIYLPLGVFVGIGFRLLWEFARKHPQFYVFVFYVVVLGSLDNGIILVQTVNDWGVYPITEYRYLDADARRAFQWVRASTTEDSVLLHAPRWETLIAQQTYRQVYCTYGGYSPTYSVRSNQCFHLYAGHYNQDALHNILQRGRVTHLLVGPLERNSGNHEFVLTGRSDYLRFLFAFSPDRYPFLTKVYDAGGWQIYEVGI